MPLQQIANDEDHGAAVREIEELWNAVPGSEEAVRLDELATLVDNYEMIRWPLPILSPIEELQGFMDMNGFSFADLARVAASKDGPKNEFEVKLLKKASAAWTSMNTDVLEGIARKDHALIDERVLAKIGEMIR
jgi:antitoxin component HigA of HigAB toxin-antitoxin module